MSLTRSSSSFRPDAVVGRQQREMMFLASSVTMTLNMVHAMSCPGVGRAGDDARLAGSSCTKRYAAESIRKVMSPS